MSQVKHHYRRPKWICLACNEPWPCDARKKSFLATYAGRIGQLRSLLGTFMLDAVADLPDPPEVLHERFVAWSYGHYPQGLHR